VEKIKVPTKIKTFFLNTPRLLLVLGSVICIALITGYCLVFFIPKTVHYTYANEVCSPLFTLLPQAQKASPGQFDLSLKGELRVGRFVYASTQVCATPTNAPKPGDYRLAIAPLGGWFASNSVVVTVPESPTVKVADIAGKNISAALPLKIPLSTADTIHSYSLAVDWGAATMCAFKNSFLSCDISKLALEPGSDYKVRLFRAFKSEEKTQLLEAPVKTLVTIKQVAASLQNDATIYDMPTAFNFEYDQDVTSVDATLEKIDGETKATVPILIKKEGKKLSIDLKDSLPRRSTFVLTIRQVIGVNGSSLEEPTVLKFTSSGGPQVKSVSVGSGAVQPGAVIIVTLDQPMVDNVDIASVASLKGVGGTVAKKSATEITYSLNAGNCQAFSLVLAKGIKSGSNNEASEAWNFDSRTICGTSSIIGYSVKGRPITAYSFGSGSTVILFTAGIHGSEPSSTTTLQAWVEYLKVNGYTIPSNKRLVIVPNTNPDGIASNTRNNSRDVNIDRNFPTANWSASIESANGTLPMGGGAHPGSEPETTALINLTRQLRPRLSVAFHAQGRLVGANKVADSVAIGNVYASTVGYKTMYDNAEAIMGYTITGEYEDWMGEELRIPAILIELPSSAGNYLSSQLTALWG